jgi:hypothetical protein
MPSLPTYDPTSQANAPGQGPLRVGGTAPKSIAVGGPGDLPSTLSAAASRQVADVELVRDLWGGTRRMRDAGPKYLPQSPGEKGQHYAARLAKAVLFNAFRRTVSGLTGFVFSKDPKLGEDVPAPIKAHWENIDNAGTHGDVFLREQLQDALQTGHNAILVEFPATGGTQTPLEEVVTGEIRPYWVPIKKENILSWRTTNENGRTILTQLVVRECKHISAGMFGDKERTQYRVFYREGRVVGFKLLEITEDKQKVLVVAEGEYPTQTEIPIAEVTTAGKRSMFESDPPLVDLAFLNVAHYQERSDYAYSKHMTCVPILYAFGFQAVTDAQGNPIELVVGPNAAAISENPEAKIGYATHDGGALGEVRQSLEELKSEMGTMGLAMLAPQKRSAETAEAKRLDKQTESSDLAVTARGLQDAVERALQFHAQYLRLDSGGSIEINRNFEATVMEPDVMAAYVTLARDLGLPLRVVLQELKQGGRIGTDVDLDELETEMITNAVAIEERKREEAELRAKQFGDRPPVEKKAA